MCTEFDPEWGSYDVDKKRKMFAQGMVTVENSGGDYCDEDYRIIYNRYTLTDYSRILDSVLMEDTLNDIMQKYQSKWNYMHDTIYLKREKCIKKAIVQAKKKYICQTENLFQLATIFHVSIFVLDAAGLRKRAWIQTRRISFCNLRLTTVRRWYRFSTFSSAAFSTNKRSNSSIVKK